MFENDKGKGFLLSKRNAQHFSVERFQAESLVCAKFAHVILCLLLIQNTSILVWLAIASISSAISSDESLM